MVIIGRFFWLYIVLERLDCAIGILRTIPDGVEVHPFNDPSNREWIKLIHLCIVKAFLSTLAFQAANPRGLPLLFLLIIFFAD